MMTRGLPPPNWRDAAGASLAPWSGALDEPLHCVQVHDESHDVRSFVLAAPGRSFRYLPGQFITLELEIDGQPVNRCYTLSSSPTRPDLVSITVKRVPGGPVSNWLHDHLKPGDTLQALGPSGEFSCFTQPAGRYLFVAGGSGITPLMSMTRALHDLASDADVVFLQCARTPDDLLFRAELEALARRMPGLRLAWLCDRADARSTYAGPLGRLDAALLARIAPDLHTRSVYTCGPAPFMAAVRDMLGNLRFDMGRYREESFAFEAAPSTAGEHLVADLSASPTSPSAPAAVVEPAEVEPAVVEPTVESGAAEPVVADLEAPAAVYEVRLAKTGRSFSCGSGQTLLQAATAAGLRLPFSCSSGACGTCKTRKLAGEVDMRHGGGIRPREIAQGWVLPCCSRPLGDVVLDR